MRSLSKPRSVRPGGASAEEAERSAGGGEAAMTDAFVYTGLPTRVVFGAGAIKSAPREARALGVSRALVLSTPEQEGMADDVARRLGESAAGVFAGAAMHTPVAVTEEAMAEVERLGADGVVAIGGGSTTGLGKAIAYRTDLPQVVLPTTYAGSEMTDILGQTENGRKTTLRDPRVRPETVIYDVELTLSLPAPLSGTSGMNAIAHAVEALYAQDRNPLLSIVAAEGIAALNRGLPGIVHDPEDLGARTDALYGAWLCAVCLGSSGIALHHKLCHVLGGSFDLPHAETHTAVLPHALAYNAPAVPEAMAILERALESAQPAAALFDLGERIGAKMALKDFGMPEEGIEKALRLTLENPYWNPRPLEPAAVRDTIAAAWAGLRPAA